MEKIERYLELIDDTGNIGYWSMVVQTNKIFWSSGIYRIHGVSPKNFDPNLEDGVRFYHPDDRAKVLAALESAINEKKNILLIFVLFA